MSVQVRSVEKKDIPGLCQILNEIIQEGGTTAMEVEVDEATFARYYVTGDDLVACHVALDQSGQLAGFQWIGINAKLPTSCADIATFTRRTDVVRGAGRGLMAATIKYANKAGFGQINATIRADNVPGLGYYSKMGFVDHSVARAMPMADGTPVDRITKRLTL